VTCEGRDPGTIWTVAGTHDNDVGGAEDAGLGDGGAATDARLDGPYEVLLDEAGTIYIAEDGNHPDWNLGRVRTVDADGIITTAVGPPTPGGVAAEGNAGTLEMYTPWGIAFDPDGILHVAASALPTAEVQTGYVYRIGPSGEVDVIAQWPAGVSSSDEPALNLPLSTVTDVYFDADGVLYITDIDVAQVWAVDPDGTARLFAGSGTRGFLGDGGPAVDARLLEPLRVASDAAGNIYITDSGNSRVRMVSTDGIITTVAGGGPARQQGDGGPATGADLGRPFGIEVGDDGSIYFADASDQLIRRVDPSGIISTVAGTGWITDAQHPIGDGGPATEATFDTPSSMTIGPDGNLYIADWENARIRMICQ
jgi:sugar lactone lactonase YvrE